MKRYIRCSAQDREQLAMREAWEYIAQKQPDALYITKNIKNEASGVIDTESLKFYAKLELAQMLAQETADRHNFFNNSIGLWTKVRRKPNRDPDYVSGKTKYDHSTDDYIFIPSGSYYWYEADGVFRRSNHWGNVASCTWRIDDENTNVTTGYIKWSDLYPKGTIYMRSIEPIDGKIIPQEWYSGNNLDNVMFELDGFTFTKPRYFN